VTSVEVNFRTFWFVMKNCRNKNGLPMKGIEMKPFHGGQNEYLYSDIGGRLALGLDWPSGMVSYLRPWLEKAKGRRFIAG